MQNQIGHWFVCTAIALALLIGGCTDGVGSSSPTTDSSGDNPSAVAQTPPSNLSSNLPRLEGKATVLMVVNGEPITIEVDGTHAPVTAGNFVDLVQKGVYDDLAFHRVVRNPEPFVVQGGDPQSKDANFRGQLGTGGYTDPTTGQERNIPLEIMPSGAEDPLYGTTFQMAGISQAPELEHTRGAVAMARSQAPNSASSQFYFTLNDLPFLDGSYAVFGYVTDGMDVVDEIQQGDRIDSARVVEGLENLQLPNQS
ncbi:peptidylprolyl isomerase [Phormidium sp. CCY1219]|jgi:peptidyl-prolyl cis-trans isomerase B (cyclophilin B)|uniref:peptidylprolyl isomerase n=1 Tax=Phormidium sp. CCY1219 TaxID=2886104 RepID=UPI002D1E637C|nr:peptidylprolyl isomerase [Phormidium sp. CCY1219]MEB3827668.1 peptidylprolyl isomerase [Phormidium sp. CCY1219]